MLTKHENSKKTVVNACIHVIWCLVDSLHIGKWHHGALFLYFGHHTTINDTLIAVHIMAIGLKEPFDKSINYNRIVANIYQSGQ